MDLGGNISGSTVLQKKDQVVLREEFDDWALIFDPDTGLICGVNPVGVKVWKLIDGNLTLKDISRIIHESFPDAPDTVEEDVTAFVNEITQKGYAIAL